MLNVVCISFQYMRDFYNQTYFKRTGQPMGTSFQTLLWSLTVSMFPLGGFFGSLMVWPLVNNCGRYVTVCFSSFTNSLLGSDKTHLTTHSSCQAQQEHDCVTPYL